MQRTQDKRKCNTIANITQREKHNAGNMSICSKLVGVIKHHFGNVNKESGAEHIDHDTVRIINDRTCAIIFHTLLKNRSKEVDHDVLSLIGAAGCAEKAGNDKEVAHRFLRPSDGRFNDITEKDLQEHNAHHADKRHDGNRFLAFVQSFVDLI